MSRINPGDDDKPILREHWPEDDLNRRPVPRGWRWVPFATGIITGAVSQLHPVAWFLIVATIAFTLTTLLL